MTNLKRNGFFVGLCLCFHFIFELKLAQLNIVTGRSGMTFVAQTIAVSSVKPETDAGRVVIPEADAEKVE